MQSDGSTLPTFELFGITIYDFKKWNVGGVFRAGVYHDMLMNKYPECRTHNRYLYEHRLRKEGVEYHKRVIIGFGLWVYDISPEWLRSKFRGL